MIRLPDNLPQPELVVASDIHIRSPEDHKYKILIEAIEAFSKVNLRYFVFLGDIFDFFLGSQSYYWQKYQQLFKQLQKLTQNHCQVIFIEGNHEFHLSPIFTQNIVFLDTPKHVVKLTNGTRVALAHGDLVYSSWQYRLFRQLIKSSWLHRLAQLIPPKILENYALAHAKGSRALDRYRPMNHQALLEAAKNWLLAPPMADIGIFGHFHIPYDHCVNIDRNTIQLLSLSCWDENINFLVLDQSGQRNRLVLQEDGLLSTSLINQNHVNSIVD